MTYCLIYEANRRWYEDEEESAIPDRNVDAYLDKGHYESLYTSLKLIIANNKIFGTCM